MTVGAVVVFDSNDEALAEAAGRPAARRIVEAAWAGGALPVVIVSDDRDERLRETLSGSPALAQPSDGAAGVAAWAVGIRAACEAVLETSALLLWPGHMTWVDPETVTSLIEAHGRSPASVWRPERAGAPGWPVLLPVALAGALDPAAGSLAGALAGVRFELSELGDPGTVLGRDVDLDALPDYAGPPEPLGGPPPEWGALAAETPDPEVTPPR